VFLDPVQWREQAVKRPALVLSVDAFNAGPAELVTVLPITSTMRALRTRVTLRPPEGGLRTESFVICEQTRTLSSSRLSRRLGSVGPNTMRAVEGVVRMLLGL
jgi:mRNA interferase MazF